MSHGCLSNINWLVLSQSKYLLWVHIYCHTVKRIETRFPTSKQKIFSHINIIKTKTIWIVQIVHANLNCTVSPEVNSSTIITISVEIKSTIIYSGKSCTAPCSELGTTQQRRSDTERVQRLLSRQISCHQIALVCSKIGVTNWTMSSGDVAPKRKLI